MTIRAFTPGERYIAKPTIGLALFFYLRAAQFAINGRGMT